MQGVGLRRLRLDWVLAVLTLTVSSQIPWELFAITWGTWWVGDSLSILIVTPLALTRLTEPRASWRRRRLAIALPLLGALALAIVVFAYTYAQERERLRLLFERQADTLAQAFQDTLHDYLDVLLVIESFHASSGPLARQAFGTFVQREFVRHPGLQAVSWDLRVPDERREAYEQAVRREGFADFQIMEQTMQGQLVRAARRPEYVVVTYIAPHAGNERALGLDVASTLERLEALQRARDRGRPAATGRLTLVQEHDRQFGLLVFVPVYGRGLPNTTVGERRQSLEGYVTGVFRIGDMIEASLLALEREGIRLRVEDETAPADQRLLYDSRARTLQGVDPTVDEAFGENPTGMHWQTTVELADRRWVMRFAPTREYLAARQSLQPWAVLGGGLAFTSLLGGFLLIITGRAIIIEQLVAGRTAQLEASQRLKAEAEQRRREAEVLAELTHTINAALDVDAVLQRVADGAMALCDSDGAAIALCEPGTEVAVIRYWSGVPSYHGVRIKPGHGIGGLVLATGRPCRTEDYERDPRLSQEYLALIRSGGTVGVLAVPIRSGEHVTGLLYVGTRQPHRFTDHDEAILQRLADHAAIALANAQLYAEVQAGRARLQEFSRRLLEAQEAERRRMAHELHDEAGQLLASVHLSLEQTVLGLPACFRDGFHHVRDHLDAIETQLRRLSHELRPTILDDLGLVPALRFLADGVVARTGLRISIDSTIAGRLAPAVETALYRIMQEGLSNVTKHAKATDVRLQLWQDVEIVHGRIEDDGIGFAVDEIAHQKGPRGLGLLGIQERLDALGGTLQITSAPGQGTTLHITLPVGPGKRAAGAHGARADQNLPAPSDLGGTA